MAISSHKKRIAYSLSDNDIRKMKEIYARDSQVSDSRIYESDTLSKMINYIFELEQRGEKEWRI